MINEHLLENYLSALLSGDRKRSRSVIEQALQSGTPANCVYMDIIWPIMLEIEDLFYSDRITIVQEHLATRINRTIVDQLQNKLPRRPEKGKKIAICCAQDEIQELGAQITADLFESDGWEVRFLGGGLTNDDLLVFIHEYHPDIFLIYGASPKQAPGVRQLIDTMKGIDAFPDMKIMLSGGLFNRAEGLWQEIGGDLFAADAADALQVASASDQYEPEIERTINRRKRSRKNADQEVTIGSSDS